MCFIFTKYLASSKTVSAMNKAELIEAVQGSLGKDATKRAAEDSVAAVLGAIANGVRTEGKVPLIGFRTFAVKNRKARMGRNPKTGEPMHIAASKSSMPVRASRHRIARASWRCMARRSSRLSSLVWVIKCGES